MEEHHAAYEAGNFGFCAKVGEEASRLDEVLDREDHNLIRQRSLEPSAYI